MHRRAGGNHRGDLVVEFLDREQVAIGNRRGGFSGYVCIRRTQRTGPEIVAPAVSTGEFVLAHKDPDIAGKLALGMGTPSVSGELGRLKISARSASSLVYRHA